MKKRTLILSLVLALTMVMGSFSFAFADIPKDGIQSYPKLSESEVVCEAFAMDLYKQATSGKYKLVDTETLYKWIEGNKKMVVIDTMPAGWYNKYHIKTALNQVVGGGPENGPTFDFQKGEKSALLKLAKDSCKVKKYYNKKTKKWQTKKIKGAKTKTVIDKSKTVVVYCGFVKCQRSHQAAKYLKSQGFKNVYRYPGGITAWDDAGYPEEGSEVVAN